MNLKKRNVFTTGIGSLPHINADSALAYSLRHDIPFLPQVPMVNQNEYMIYQSLYPLPGISKPQNSMSFVDLKKWAIGRREFLEEAKIAQETNNYSYFAPTNDIWSCLTPFLFELQENKRKSCKLQICGPFTCISSLKLDDHTPIKNFPDLVDDVELCFQMSLMALLEKFKKQNLKIYLFIDEPGLVIYSPQDDFLSERFDNLMKLAKLIEPKIHRLGLHCCSDTRWEDLIVAKNSFDMISFDYNLSSHKIAAIPSEARKQFIKNGKNYAIGTIPTNHDANLEYQLKSEQILQLLPEVLESKKEVLLTAGCGLAHAQVIDAEDILNQLYKEADALANA